MQERGTIMNKQREWRAGHIHLMHALILIGGSVVTAVLLLLMVSIMPVQAGASLPSYRIPTPAQIVTDTGIIMLPAVMNHFDPTKPRMISPMPGAQLDTLAPEFEFDMGWNHAANASGIVGYSTNPVFVDPDIGATFPLSPSVRTVHLFVNLTPNTVYYWSVGLVYNYDYDNAEWTDPISFTTPANGVILPAPSLLAPITGSLAALDTLVLQWSPVAGAAEYSFVIRNLNRNEGYIDIVTDTQVAPANTWIGQQLTPGHRYSWRVKARNEYAWSDTSETWEFVLIPDLINAAETVLIPAGDFLMGCNSENQSETCVSNEQPLHSVFLDAYRIDRYEVTNARYQACVTAGGCSPPHANSSSTRPLYYDNPTYADYPVIRVDWYQASQFCAWDGGRLPTEAQWEKAARGVDGARKFPWGDLPPNQSLLNYNNQIGDTTRVGSYPDGASQYGTMDMAGNVTEWVHDWYNRDYYATSPASNPQGADTGTRRVLRGGAWAYQEMNIRLAFRDRVAPEEWDSAWGRTGFRCARNP